MKLAAVVLLLLIPAFGQEHTDRNTMQEKYDHFSTWGAWLGISVSVRCQSDCLKPGDAYIEGNCEETPTGISYYLNNYDCELQLLGHFKRSWHSWRKTIPIKDGVGFIFDQDFVPDEVIRDKTAARVTVHCHP